MSFIPLVPALLFKAATTVLDNLGFSSERVVEKVGVPLWQHCESRTRVPGGHFYTLVGQAGRAVGTEEFGYLIPRYTPITALDAFSKQLGQSLTVYEAVKTFSRLYAQMSSIDLFGSVEDGKGLWWLRKRVQAADRAGRQQMELGALLYMIQTVRLGAGPDWAPEKICLEAESLSAMYRLSDFGNAAIVEGQGASGFLIPRSLFARRIPAERSSTLPHNASKLFFEAPSNEFPESLRQIVSSYFSFGQPRIEEIADVAGMGVRTLQRRLRENGLTYKRVVDQALFNASTDLLRDPHVKLIEVAHEMGYSDQANFNRAFRRCAGITPGEYRLQRQSVQS
jgi:AraC-like DNA-binding protein